LYLYSDDHVDNIRCFNTPVKRGLNTIISIIINIGQPTVRPSQKICDADLSSSLA